MEGGGRRDEERESGGGRDEVEFGAEDRVGTLEFVESVLEKSVIWVFV